jgi:cell fate regulator YaaT (PSP1 superfamily)
MARDQNLFVKPEKFSGACGKLQCCLKYEHDFYLSQKSGIPDTGSIIQTEKGKTTVSIIDVFNGTVTLDFESGETLVMKKEDLVAKLEKAYKVIRNSKDEKSENGCSGCPKSNFLNYDGNETKEKIVQADKKKQNK